MTNTGTTENIIRDLVALGDTIGRTAVDLICVLEGTMTGVDWSVRTEAKNIVERHLGRPMTDSDIDDLLDATDTDDDSFND